MSSVMLPGHYACLGKHNLSHCFVWTFVMYISHHTHMYTNTHAHTSTHTCYYFHSLSLAAANFYSFFSLDNFRRGDADQLQKTTWILASFSFYLTFLYPDKSKAFLLNFLSTSPIHIFTFAGDAGTHPHIYITKHFPDVDKPSSTS